MEAIDYMTDTEQPNPKHLVLLQAKAHRELSSYDSQARVQWLERKPKAHIITAEDNKMSQKDKQKQNTLTGKTLRFKKPLDNNNGILKKSSNESEDDDDDDDEYTVHIGSVITDIGNDNYGEENMYDNEDYYTDVAPNVVQANQISSKVLKTEAQKPLLKFKSAEHLNTWKTIIKAKMEEKVFDDSDKTNTKNIVDNKTLPKSITKNLPKTQNQKLVQEKIFWSIEVENIVPKGKYNFVTILLSRITH